MIDTITWLFFNARTNRGDTLGKVITKKLSAREQLEIIENDPILWLGNFIEIIDNNNEQIPFILNDAQRDFVKNRDRFNIISKTRQLGMSTLMLGMMLWSAHTKPNSQYLMVTDKGDNTQNLFNRLKNMYDSIPDNIRLKDKKSNLYELILENNSRISVQTAGSKEIGRGFSVEICHLSEFAFWNTKVQKTALVSLEQSLLKNESAFLCIESTSNGVGNQYYNIFTGAEKGNSKYKSFFYGYATDTFRKMFKFEIAEAKKWAMAQNKGQHYTLDRYHFYPDELELYEKYDLTVDILLWRRYKISDIGEDAFNQEFPISADISFIQSDNSFFNAVDITERYKHLPEPLSAREIGIDLPDSLQKYLGNGLYIYQPIKSNEIYYGGIDSSAGLKGDYSAISMLDSSGENVAVFYRNDIPIYQFARVCYDLGHLFNYCMYAIERNSYGLSLIDRLRMDMKYINVLRFSKFDKIRGALTSEYGLHVTNVNKTKVMNDLKEVFETGLILVNDKETLDQMKIYTQKGNGSLGNTRGSGNHDDLVDALALSVQSFKQNKSYI